MIYKHDFPIIEFDDCRTALINPDVFSSKNSPRHSKLVITFFKDAISKLIEYGELQEYLTVSGENDLTVYKFNASDTILIHGIIGCPATAGFLDELIGRFAVEKVIFCGGGGVLDKSIDVGKIMLVEGAIRDEGFSYHYLLPSRIIYTDEQVRISIKNHLDELEIPYFEGICWTTDAFFRETRDMISHRKSEGAKIVEMEQSGCIAVSKFRNIKYGALIYAGDDVSGAVWDSRSWRDREGIRYNLVKLCRDLLDKI